MSPDSFIAANLSSDALSGLSMPPLPIERIPNSVDHSFIERNTTLYGAKAASLLAFEKVLSSVQKVLRPLHASIEVPAIDVIPVKVFEKWLEGKSVAEDLKAPYRKINGAKYMVRSSAVYSESAGSMSGSGVYHSEALPSGASFDKFYEAVERVFASATSEAALRHQQRLNIKEEKMAVLLTPYVEESRDAARYGDGGRGTINSVLYNIPALLEIVRADNLRPIIKRAELARFFANPLKIENVEDIDVMGSMFHYQLDRNEMMSTVAFKLAFTGYALELAFGRPVQIEYVHSNHKFFIVQTGCLPPAWSEAKYAILPADLKPLFKGAAVGVIDEEMNITRDATDRGLLVVASEFKSSRIDLSPYFPQAPHSAVVCLEPCAFASGHVLTAAALAGLPIIFSPEILPESEVPDEGLRVTHLWTYPSIQGHRRVRVVANGIEGAIYPVAA
jgi:hypothetical protein